jgi:photosystem II stability/assembly factor-like uncharacterized protein
MVFRLWFFVYIWAFFSFKEPKLYFIVNARKVGNLIGRDNDIKGLYVGTPNDVNTTWQHLGWENNIVWDVVVQENSDGKIIFLSCLNGVMRSKDDGKTWKILTNWEVSDALKIYAHPQHPQTLYTLTSAGIWKSTDGGESWECKNKGLKPVSQTFMTCLLFPAKKNMHLLAGTANGIVISKNAGESWQTLALAGQEIHSLVACPDKADFLFCATEENGLFASQDAGKTWQSMNKGLNSKTIYEVVFQPQSPNIVYCGGHQSGLYKTENLGEKWELLDNELKGKSIKSIAIHPEKPEIIFVGCLEGGLYKSTDGGKSFQCVGECDGRVWKVLLMP